MYLMFKEAEFFNQPIGSWSVGTVTDMRNMFRKAEAFNQPMGTWEVGSVRSMELMFWGAASFNQALGWCVESNVDLSDGRRTNHRPKLSPRGPHVVEEPPAGDARPAEYKKPDQPERYHPTPPSDTTTSSQ